MSPHAQQATPSGRQPGSADGAAFDTLLGDLESVYARLNAALRTIPEVGLRKWAGEHLDLIGRALEAEIADPWFILPALHGTCKLTNVPELDADPARWFARKGGFSIKDVNAFKKSAAWLFQPSHWPLDPEKSGGLSTAKCTNLQRQEQARMRRALADHQISLRGIEQLTRSVNFLRSQVRHLGPVFILEALELFGRRPDLHALHEHVARQVRDVNLALNECPIPDNFNQVRFGGADLNGMMNIAVRCNAQLGNAIKRRLTDFIDDNPELINRKLHPYARAFQALNLLVHGTDEAAGRGGNATTDRTPEASIGVVLTLDEYKQACTNAGQRVTTDLGTRVFWDNLQRGRVRPLDWIMILGEHGTTVKEATSERFATMQQRILMSAAAPFCAYPNCDQRSGDSQAHHVVPHGKGGATSLDNLAFLCRYHHPLHDDTRSRPGGFHVELDGNRIPYILRHEPGAVPEYNSLNLEHSAIVRATSGRADGTPQKDSPPG